jgi:YggT family protein
MQTLCVWLGGALGFLLKAFQILVVVQWVFWLVGADPYNPIVRAVSALTEPMLGWLRRRLPFLAVGTWDLSPMAAIFICYFLDRVLVVALVDLAARF